MATQAVDRDCVAASRSPARGCERVVGAHARDRGLAGGQRFLRQRRRHLRSGRRHRHHAEYDLVESPAAANCSAIRRSWVSLSPLLRASRAPETQSSVTSSGLPARFAAASSVHAHHRPAPVSGCRPEECCRRAPTAVLHHGFLGAQHRYAACACAPGLLPARTSSPRTECRRRGPPRSAAATY